MKEGGAIIWEKETTFELEYDHLEEAASKQCCTGEDLILQCLEVYLKQYNNP